MPNLHDRAKRVLAGGVSTSVRMAETPAPFYVKRAEGSHIWDLDGNEYIDYVCGFGPIILGHALAEVNQAVCEQLGSGQQFGATTEAEVELAERLCRLIPSLEVVRFSSSGSEAVHAAIRLARAATDRLQIIKFAGHYHGWFDSVLISTHPPADARGPRIESAGVPARVADEVCVLPFNDTAALDALFARDGSRVAAVILEPIMGNGGCIAPEPGYLRHLRRLCDAHGALLIFDEVITGFRVDLHGAQGLFGIRPDLSVFGKAVASGFPLSVLGGRRELMERIARGEVNHSGTFNGNLAAVSAANCTLQLLEAHADELYPRLRSVGCALMDGLIEAGRRAGVAVHAQGPGPIFWVSILRPEAAGRAGVTPFTSYEATFNADAARYERFRELMRARGVRLMPSGRWYVCGAHTDADVEVTLAAATDALAELASAAGA